MPTATNIQSILDLIDADPSLGILFQELSEEKSLLPKLLFIHRNQLFPTVNDIIRFRYIFWDNYTLSPGPGTSVVGVEQKMTKLKRAPKEMETSFEDLANNIRDVVVYYAIKLFRTNKELKSLVNSEPFDFTEVKKILKDYSSIMNSFEQLFKEIFNVDAIKDETIKKKAEYLVNLKWLSKNLLSEFMSMATIGLRQIIFFPMVGHEIKKRIFDCQGLTENEYTAIVNGMYMFHLFDQCNSVFWCEDCRDYRQIYSSTSMIDPHHANMCCLKCQKPMLAAIAYHPKDSLLKCIDFEGGILAIYLGNLLKKKNIDFKPSVQTKYENDFICTTDNGMILIECRMHRTDVIERGLKNNLRKDIKQLINHAQALKEEGKTVVLSIAVSNYESHKIKNLVDQMNESREYRKDINEYNIKIIGYDQVTDVLDKIRNS